MQLKVYNSGIHHGEERLIAGNARSGLITFSGCHLACHFCYTPETSIREEGTKLTPAEFLQDLRQLRNRGALNINLISPTHVWNAIVEPVLIFKMENPDVCPVLLKTSGYESVPFAHSAAFADCFIPDFKVATVEAATQVGLPRNYGDTAQRFVAALLESHGPSHYNAKGELDRGIIVRHLLMPGHDEESQAVLHRLSEIGYRGWINFMTRFVSPSGLAQAPTQRVMNLTERARDMGMCVLVNGQLPPTAHRSEVAHG